MCEIEAISMCISPTTVSRKSPVEMHTLTLSMLGLVNHASRLSHPIHLVL